MIAGRSSTRVLWPIVVRRQKADPRIAPLLGMTREVLWMGRMYTPRYDSSSKKFRCRGGAVMGSLDHAGTGSGPGTTDGSGLRGHARGYHRRCAGRGGGHQTDARVRG